MTPRSWYYAKLAAFSAFPFCPCLCPSATTRAYPGLVPHSHFIGIPVLDLLMGLDLTQPLASPAPRLAVAWLRTIPRLYFFSLDGNAHLGRPCLGFPRQPGWQRLAYLSRVAVATAFATCVAHELLHGPRLLIVVSPE